MDSVSQNVKLSWWEDADMDLWGGAGPMITLEYDPDNKFMLFVTVAYNRRKAAKGRALTADQLRTSAFKQLEAAHVFAGGEGVTDEPVGIVAM